LNKFVLGGSAYEVVVAADDNIGVASVLLQNLLNGVSRQAVFVGANRWSEQIPIVVGRSNHITATALDAAGNPSSVLPFIMYEVGTNTGSSTATTATTLKAVGGNP
jgi:hypothetical protein